MLLRVHASVLYLLQTLLKSSFWLIKSCKVEYQVFYRGLHLSDTTQLTLYRVVLVLMVMLGINNVDGMLMI